MIAAVRTLLGVALFASTAAAADSSFVTFESGQVRPLALAPDGSRLFAVNTPDNRLEILAVTAEGLRPTAAVPVGLEPVAVAARTSTEVWVVNHLSDSISIVDVGATPPRVVRTLLVGDEPRDIVFAGPGGNRAFITTAHRGQNSPIDPQFTTPGIGRADVWVFDALRLDDSPRGNPLTILTLFGDTPRALAVSPDGLTVYAAVFHSGNQTTTVSHANICDGGVDEPCVVEGMPMPGGLPGPDTNVEGVARPKTSMIVRFNDATHAWEDVLERDWSNAIRFALPDEDVFVIDATADPPVEVGAFSHVGTIIYNLAVNPVSGTIYATNTEARNEVRFAGMGVFGGSTVRGHQHESRITVIDGHTVTPRHLNKHIDYAVVPSPPQVKERSLALPTGVAVSRDGATLYVAALGSSQVGVFNTAQLENDTFVPAAADHVQLRGGGPTGVVLDDVRQRLYVLTRFDNGVSVVNTATRHEDYHLRLHNPEPSSVIRGRELLYSAAYTSSNGEGACASCHVFGDFDSLAWDLGDPDGPVVRDPNPVIDSVASQPPDFHPMKGPMTTQTLRGLATHGPLHWRGDRTAAYNGGDPFDEQRAFEQFNPAFVDLLGRATPLTNSEIATLAHFVLQIVPPPNPVRGLDNALTPAQQLARDAFFGANKCSECHVLDPAQGYFGTSGVMAKNDSTTQFMKIPHLNNVYQKMGLGVVPAPFNGGDTSFAGDQVRGFGLFNDGAFGLPPSIAIDEIEFLLAFDTNLAPIVGQQLTLNRGNSDAAAQRIDLLVARAQAGECDLTVKGNVGGEQRGWYRNGSAGFQSDRAAEAPISDSALRLQAVEDGQELTYTCVPPGSGVRVGVDRDGDGVFDRDELDAHTDPAHPLDACPGDCNDDRTVRVDELITAVNMAAGRTSVNTCLAADTSDDGQVRIDELVRAVRAALDGC